jgi:hypothetical protein
MLENVNENVKNQYELLNILDSKASALLTFNAIALASISIWLGYVPLNYLHLALDLIFIVLLLSCGFYCGSFGCVGRKFRNMLTISTEFVTIAPGTTVLRGSYPSDRLSVLF